MMNNAHLIGRLTKDVELKRTQSGKTVANFTLAVNRPFAKKDSGQQTADFFRCQAWERTADVLRQFTHKGSQIGVTGRLQSRNYENDQGQKIQIVEIIVERLDLLDSHKTDEQSRDKAKGGSDEYEGGYGEKTLYGAKNSQHGSGIQYDRNVRPSENPYVPADEYGIDADDLPF